MSFAFLCQLVSGTSVLNNHFGGGPLPFFVNCLERLKQHLEYLSKMPNCSQITLCKRIPFEK